MLDALRHQKISAAGLLEQTFERIDRLNPVLNAIVVQDRREARKAAAIADTAIRHGEQRPLLGLPMTVKECFDIAGLPTTWGTTGTGQAPATRDSVIVGRLRTAGAIVFGKTNVPPNLADWQSSNPVYGRTSNPWDSTRTPGGSSGGSAAALAGGLVALEMGSDIGGRCACRRTAVVSLRTSPAGGSCPCAAAHRREPHCCR
ncbi:MAG: amidase family protein [Burkholderiaceae bacterium]